MEWRDASAELGATYEYLVAERPVGTGEDLFATLHAGIDYRVPPRGKLILLVDGSTQTQALTTELATLEHDLVGDGWTVLRHNVERSRSVAEIKALIRSIWAGDPEHVKALLLFGHVAVPYSGKTAFDGHYSVEPYGQHTGAWAADNYYAELSSGFGPMGWTDSEVNDTGAAYADYRPRPENFNVPGDGKFDQDFAPSELELAVGRVDLSNMPAFQKSETALLKQYLLKDHEYRTASGRFFTPPRPRVVVTNLLTQWLGGVSFTSDAVERFAPSVGLSSFVMLDAARIGYELHKLTDRDDALWSINDDTAFFRGQYHIATTAQLAANQSLKIPFYSLFGSFFGDWEISDNYLRAPLCTSGYGLAAIYGTEFDARELAFGATIGEAMRRSVKPISYSLMGDPTLRLQVVPPPSTVAVRATATGGADLRWGSSRGSLLGFNVYRSDDEAGPFTLVNTTGPITGNRLVLGAARPGEWFMVRAVRREQNGSGTFLNESEGPITRLGPAPASSPTILQQPVSAQALPGKAVAFAVRAFGGDLSYQWYRTGAAGGEQALVGETRPGLIIPAADASKLGNYRCQVRNSNGSTWSNSVQLSLHTELPLPRLSMNVPAQGRADVPAFDPHLPGVTARLLFNSAKGEVRQSSTSPSGLEYLPHSGFDGHDELQYVVEDGLSSQLGTIAVEIIDTPSWGNDRLPGLSGEMTYPTGTALGGSSRVNGADWEMRGYGHSYDSGDLATDYGSFGYFEHQSASGDFDVVVHSVRFDGDYGNAGLAIWNGHSAGQRYAFLGLDRSSIVSHYLRFPDVEGASTLETLGSTEEAGRYLRLRRRGDTIFRDVSRDGVSWSQVGAPLVFSAWNQSDDSLERSGLPESLEVGLFVAGSAFEPGPSHRSPSGPDPEGSIYRAAIAADYFHPAVAVFRGYAVVSPPRPLPEMRRATVLSDGRFQFEIAPGQSGAVYQVLGSTDLAQWAPLLTSAAAGVVTLTPPAGADRQFYRLQLGDERSTRAIGFVRVVVPGRNASGAGGYALLANPLLSASTSLSALLPSAPPGTAIWKYRPLDHQYVESNNPSGSAWSEEESLGPGVGFFVRMPGPEPLTINFVGEVLEGRLHRTLRGPMDLFGSMQPLPRALPAHPSGWPEVMLYRYDAATNGFDNSPTYSPMEGWGTAPPVLRAAEGVIAAFQSDATSRMFVGELGLP
ncbi:MAG: immunoglobulin domain-containing protein [Myxococcota bacterium]